jgi:hypothetical protein
MTLIDTWEAVPAGRAGAVRVTVPVGPRPLVARLTPDELAAARPILDEAVEAQRRNEYSRVQFAEALRVAIGRDPFRQARGAGQGLLPVRADAGLAFIGLVFAVSSDEVWRRVTGCAVAVICLADLAVHALRRFRGTSM